ncbi:hypothetical protein FRUB_02026 [Fimbriiglobus ruber]|uniref:Thioredoxin domain-containing protein n=1 Tax=Fimbriiglobus ruber TaxID=1908690 RepID=A0A225EAX0_9BACT|nr:hypothetical protein FRUB_02026 [Fimbriiglobus ruber]
MRFGLVGLLAAVIGGYAGAADALPPTPHGEGKQPVELVMEDQFGRRQDIAAYKGDVLILVYGDRKGTDASREFGESLHILFHPTAAGQTPAKARGAAVAPLQGVPVGQRSPDAVVIPVAVAGNVPTVIKDLIRVQIKKASPELPIWLDFTGVMEKDFGLRPGQANLAVFDATGRLRMRINGTPDKKAVDQLLQKIQDLRAEAAGLSK